MHGKSFMDIPNTNQSLHVQKVHMGTICEKYFCIQTYTVI